MIPRSRNRAWHVGVWTVVLATAAVAWTASAAAQAPGMSTTELRDQIERRFDVVPLRDGLALVPRSPVAGVRSIELAGGSIAIDGVAVTGAEVRQRLGQNADLVLQLSYLDPAARRALFAPAPAAPSAPAAPAAPATPEPSAAPITPAVPEPPRRANRLGDQVRIGGSVTVDEDEVVAGDVVAIGGSVRIDGEVRGEVVAVGGGVELGPRALVTRDIVVVGGVLTRAEGSRIQGRLHEVSIGDINWGDWRWGWNPSRPFPGFSRTLALMSTLGRIAVLCVLAVFIMLLGREYVERVSVRAAAEPLKAGAIGFLAQLMFLPVLVVTILILVVTIVGIPLLLLVPFAVLALVVVALVGFTAIGYRVGLMVSTRMGWHTQAPYAATLIGILIVVSPLVLARLLSLVGGPIVPMAFALGAIGFLAEYVAWTVGFGAVALVRFAGPRTPPPAGPMPPPVMVP
jgi:hypothetical protein